MLVAMNASMGYVCPSRFLVAEKADLLARLRQETDQNEWFCPHCYAASNGKDIKPVSLVNPKAKVTHFRHKIGNRKTECRNYRKEGDQHLTAKMAVLANCANQNGVAVVEQRKYSTDRSIYRVPDITVNLASGESHAHEIQISKINGARIAERTDSLVGLGFDQVHWYLHTRNFRDEVVNFLVKHQQCRAYHIQFDEHGMPRWEAITSLVQKRSPPSSKQSHHPLFFRYSQDGTRWTYHIKSDTLAIYYGRKGQKHDIRLPGNKGQQVGENEICDPAAMATGGLGRWPILQPSEPRLVDM